MNKVKCHYIDNREEYFNAEDLIFRPSVYGVLIKDGRVALVKQRGGYDFPGGGIKIHETIEQALKREFWEETGIKIKIGEIIHCQTSFFVLPKLDGKKHPSNCLVVYYTCTMISGEFTTENFSDFEKREALYPEWVDLSKIEKIKYQNSVNSVSIIKKAQTIS